MDTVQESTRWDKSFGRSLLVNILFGLVIFGLISLLQFNYFDHFWTSWVLFVSCLAIAYIAWKETDPYRGKWHLNGLITRSAGVAVLLILAVTIGF